MAPGEEKKTRKVLLLAANPKGTVKLRLDEEERRIKDALRLSRGRDHFEITTESAVTIAHIRRALLEHEPEIVHFCGHGAGFDGIVCEDETGNPKLIPTFALANLFALIGNHVKCVVLNACFAEVQASAVVDHIDYVVGMKSSIGDNAALNFAEGFYDALFSGKTFPQCYQWGVNAIQLEDIPEDSTPVMKVREGTSPVPCAVEIDTTPQVELEETTVTRAFVQSSAGTPDALTELVPNPERLNQVRELLAGLYPHRKRILVASLSVALVASLVYLIASQLSATAPNLVGTWIQEKYGTPAADSASDIHKEAVQAWLSVTRDPVTGKLAVVELTTVQLYFVPNQNQPLTTYTVEWRYREVDRIDATTIKIEGHPHQRFGLDLGVLNGLASPELTASLAKFSEGLSKNFSSAKGQLRINGEGQLEKYVTYSGGASSSYTYIRN